MILQIKNLSISFPLLDDYILLVLIRHTALDYICALIVPVLRFAGIWKLLADFDRKRKDFKPIRWDELIHTIRIN